MKKARSNWPLARILWSLTARYFLHAEDRGVILGLAATERVAAFILEMNSRIGADGELDLPMKGADIADYIDVTAETIAQKSEARW